MFKIEIYICFLLQDEKYRYIIPIIRDGRGPDGRQGQHVAVRLTLQIWESVNASWTHMIQYFRVMNMAGWWFEPLWQILVNWDDYSQYMGK